MTIFQTIIIMVLVFVIIIWDFVFIFKNFQMTMTIFQKDIDQNPNYDDNFQTITKISWMSMAISQKK